MEALKKIQQELNAPKNQKNNFGNYNYRSCEDILEALKPLLKKYNAQLTITDDIKNIGHRYYVESTCIFSDGEKTISCKAYAREAENKKGMDESQITGAASSYARKYALNAMFLIDDVKDADTRDNKTVEPTAEEKLSIYAAIKEAIEEAKSIDNFKKIGDMMRESQGVLDQKDINGLIGLGKQKQQELENGTN